MSDTETQWRHICEVCGVEEILTPGDAFDLGWDYPPRMGQFGVVGPRCCPLPQRRNSLVGSRDQRLYRGHAY
ncbi:MAG: hypothetical protein WBB00_13270 [Mycobacterium sp.]